MTSVLFAWFSNCTCASFLRILLASGCGGKREPDREKRKGKLKGGEVSKEDKLEMCGSPNGINSSSGGEKKFREGKWEERQRRSIVMNMP